MANPRQAVADLVDRDVHQASYWGVLSFGYFLLDKQKKVTRAEGTKPRSADCMACVNVIGINGLRSKLWFQRTPRQSGFTNAPGANKFSAGCERVCDRLGMAVNTETEQKMWVKGRASSLSHLKLIF